TFTSLLFCSLQGFQAGNDIVVLRFSAKTISTSRALSASITFSPFGACISLWALFSCIALSTFCTCIAFSTSFTSWTLRSFFARYFDYVVDICLLLNRICYKYLFKFFFCCHSFNLLIYKSLLLHPLQLRGR